MAQGPQPRKTIGNIAGVPAYLTRTRLTRLVDLAKQFRAKQLKALKTQIMSALDIRSHDDFCTYCEENKINHTNVEQLQKCVESIVKKLQEKRKADAFRLERVPMEIWFWNAHMSQKLLAKSDAGQIEFEKYIALVLNVASELDDAVQPLRLSDFSGVIETKSRKSVQTCVHVVTAKSANVAKSSAIREHFATCLGLDVRPYTANPRKSRSKKKLVRDGKDTSVNEGSEASGANEANAGSEASATNEASVASAANGFYEAKMAVDAVPLVGDLSNSIHVPAMRFGSEDPFFMAPMDDTELGLIGTAPANANQPVLQAFMEDELGNDVAPAQDTAHGDGDGKDGKYADAKEDNASESDTDVTADGAKKRVKRTPGVPSEFRIQVNLSHNRCKELAWNVNSAFMKTRYQETVVAHDFGLQVARQDRQSVNIKDPKRHAFDDKCVHGDDSTICSARFQVQHALEDHVHGCCEQIAPLDVLKEQADVFHRHLPPDLANYAMNFMTPYASKYHRRSAQRPDAQTDCMSDDHLHSMLAKIQKQKKRKAVDENIAEKATKKLKIAKAHRSSSSSSSNDL